MFTRSMRWMALLVLVMSCGDESSPDERGFGSLQVQVRTVGGGIDSSYVLVIDGMEQGPIGANETRIISDLHAGHHVVRLEGRASNCSFDRQLPSSIHVPRDDQAELEVRLTCRAAGPVRLIVYSSGAKVDQDGYRYGLDATPSTVVGRHDTILLPSVSPGEHRFRFNGVDPDCSPSPSLSVEFDVIGDATLDVWFTVACRSFAGDRIVFASTMGGGTTRDDLELWSIRTDGSDPVRLTTNSVADDEPALSHGMYWIAFRRDSGGGPSRVLTRVYDGAVEWPISNSGGEMSSPAWSIDGYAAWVERSGSSSVFDLRITDLWDFTSTIGSTAPNRVTRRFSPSWGSNQYLAFATDSSINSIRANGTEERMLRRVSGVTHVDWSRVGDRIVFNAPAVPDASRPGLQGTGAWVMNADGSGLVQVMTAETGTQWNSPRWDPTGTRLVFSRVAGGSANSAIWTANGDGTGAVELTGVGNMNLHPVWP